MFSGYGNMDPYTQHLPHLREHIPTPYHYYPNWEPTLLHMKTDSFNQPSAFGPWPYNNQVEHHNCCNHSYPPGYYSFRPPYLHYQHPPQMYNHRSFPPYHDAYPPFFIPPPHIDRARFDYDKDKIHCCGCPNHISHRKEGSNVKIEEQKATPTIDEGPLTMPKGNHNSLIQFPYNHYPMMWLPDNGTRDGDVEKMMESLPSLNFKDNLKDLRQGQGESTHQEGNKVLQLPYPIFWLPGNDKLEEPVKDKKEIDTTPKADEDWPSKLKIVPLKLLENENRVEKPGVVEDEAKTQHSMDRVADKGSKSKTIPVMHLDSSNGEKISMLERPKDALQNSIAEEKMKNVATKKDTGKRKPSLPKISKLPPVCLRVEPLPKKNGSNGKGHSLSSPSLKEKVKTHDDENGPAAIMRKDTDNTPIKDIEVIDVKYQPSGEEGKDKAATIVSEQCMKGIEEQCSEKDRTDSTIDVGVQVNGNVAGNKEREDCSIGQEQKIEQNGKKVDTADNNKKQMRKNYSPEDAALLIQSAFRGFNVRRWKPVEKLQKIVQIRGKVIDVKNQIQNYEGSLELDVKQKVILSETLMTLLLQLDAIQGLLPSLREVRKSVARDLVYLQDKLDRLYGQATNIHEEGTRKKDENSSLKSAASDITSTSDEKICLASGSHMKEDLSEQPSSYLKEDNVFVRESGGSSIACEHVSAVLDKTSCAVVEDEAQEPVGPHHALPLAMLNDQMVPSGDEHYQAPQHEDENDRQAGNLLSAEGKASIYEKSVGQYVVELPSEIEVSNFVLKQQPDADQNTKCKEMQAFKEQDLNDKNENPLEQLISEEERMVVKPNEANKQSFVEDVALKVKSESEELADIKPEDVIGETNDKAILEESNVVGDAFVGSEELKCQVEHSNQPSDVENDETQLLLSVKEDNEMNGSAETEAELCVESVATPIQINNSQKLAEVSSEIPAAETSITASTGQDAVASLEVLESRIMDNETSVVPEVASERIGCANSNELPITSEAFVCESGLKELVDDNEKLRKMLEKLLLAGREQMEVIADLNERVKNLERKLSKRKKVKVNQKKLNMPSLSVVGNGKVLSYEQVASSAA